MPKAVISKRWFAILVMALLIVISAATMAFLTDRVDHTMQFTTASFNADTYKLTRTAPVGPFCAGEQVTATLKESNAGSDDVNSVISMKATWVSPDTALSIFGNDNAADNAKLSIGGANVSYTVSADKKSITFNLPEHVLEAGAANKSRDLTLTIPESFKSTGHIEFTFDKVVVTPVSGGFTNEYSRTELNASSQLDYSAKVGWAASSITAQNGKALMGYLTDKNSSGKFGIEFEFAYNYTESPMKDFSSRTDAKWSHYKGAVDTLTFVEGMTSIGDYAFPDFTGVKSVSFPATVRTIGVSAFDASGLTGTVTIPATVKEIRSLAFGNLPNVKTFTFGHGSGDTLTLPDNTAAGKRNTGAFYVPAHVDTTVNTTVEAIMYGYKWHDGYDNRRLVPTLNAQDTWFRTYTGEHNYEYTAKLDEEKLETVTFADYHMPVVGETAWDASDPSVPGTVTAYLSANKTSLILAGNGYGLIFANEDSSGAFSSLTALKTVSNTELLDTRNATTMADMFNFDQKLANISVSTWNVSKVENMSNMFYSCDSLPSIDLKKNTCTAKDGSGTYIAWNTSALKNTGGMFMDYGGPKHSLTTVDTTGWDTSKLEDASYMFMECRGLTTVKGIESWDVSSLKTANNMFQDCEALETINVSNWKTTSLENASVMFSSCHSLRSIDVSKWDMSKVTKSNAMFSYCKSFTELTIPKSLVVIGSYFAGNCPKLTTITFNHPAGTDIQFSSEAFYIYNNDKEESEDGYIEYTPVKPLGTRVVTSNQKVLDYNWTSDHRGYAVEIKAVEGGTLTGTPLASYNGRKAVVAINGVTVKFTTTPDADYSYEGATIQYSQNGVTKTVTLDKNTRTWVMPVVDDKVTEADVVVTPKWKVSAIPMLAKQDSWQYNGTDTDGNPTTPIDYDLLETINIVDKYTPASGETSWDASTNETVDGTAYTGKVTVYLSADKKTLTIAGNGYGKIFANPDSEWAFTKAYDGMPALKKISGADILDTQLMVKAGGMFAQNRNLESVNVSNWNTGKLQNTSAAGGYYGMFMNCAKLKALDVSGWNTGNVTETVRMFAGCSLLTTIDVSGWKTAKITNMNEMFSGAGISQIAVNGGGWDTSNLVYSYGMFEDCANLTEIDLSTWNVSKLEKAFSMFENSGLKSIDLSTWDESIVNSVYDMFRNCKALTSVNLNGWNLSHMENGTTDDRKGSAGMFSGCTALTKLTIPASLTMFGRNFAANCTSLTTIEFLHDAGTALTFPTAGSTYGAFYVPSYLATNVAGANASAQGYDWVTDNRKLEMISVPAQIGTLTYNGNAQSPTWNSNYESAKMTMSGVTSGVNAGSYIAKFTPKTGYIWTDGTTATKSVTWKIGKAPGSLTLSRSAATIDYNASTTTFTVTRAGDGAISVTSSNTNIAAVSVSGTTVTVTKKAPGTATITVSVAEGTNHFAPANKTCAITCIGSLTVPSQKGTLTYTGSSQTPSWNNYDSTKMTMAGTTSGTNAGSYTATFTPKTYYKWSDGASGAKNVTWKIGKAPGSLGLSKYTATIDYNATTTTFTVTRAGNGTISATSSDINIAAVSVSGTTVTVTKKAPGAATITVKVAAGTNHLAPADKTCEITCIGSLTIPSQKNTLTYTGSSQTPTWNDYDPDYMTMAGTTSGTNAGSYTATFTPKTYYKWSDGASGAKNVTWKIGKAPGSLTLSKTEAEIGADATTTTFTVNRAGDGSISVATSNSSVVTASVSGTTVTVTKKGGGTAVITVSVAEGTNYLAPADAACKVTCKTEPVLAPKNTWYRGSVKGYTITDVSFVDRYTPTGTEDESWDASAAQDKSVMAYRTGTKVVVAGDGSGSIYANKDSSEMFNFYECDRSDGWRIKIYDTQIASIQGLEILDTSRVTNMSEMFRPGDADFSVGSLTEIKGISEWDTSKVTDMSGMFMACTKLTGLDLSNWDTSNVTRMSSMFARCNNLTSLDVTNFNTSNVKYMGGMFRECSGLTSLDVTKFDTSNVISMTSMFEKCNNLTSLDVTNFDTSKVADMGKMFMSCENLTSLDVTKFDTSNAVSMSYMFGGCSGLTTLDVTGFDTSKVTSTWAMFRNCGSLTSVGDLSGWDTAAVEETMEMFSGCINLTSVGDLSKWNLSNAIRMQCMFQKCEKLTSVDVSNFNPVKAESMYEMFEGCRSLKSLDLSKWNMSRVRYTDKMFYRCVALTSVGDLSGWDTSSITNASCMFGGCYKLASLDVSNFDTSNVEDMSSMFNGCWEVSELDVSRWDTSKVTNMAALFAACKKLTSLDVSGWDTSNVTKMTNMFGSCGSNGFKLDLSKWNTSKVTDMYGMFRESVNLTEVNLTGWDTSKVTDMGKMFNKCSALTSLGDVTGWDLSNVTNFAYLFEGCSALPGLDLSGWKSPKVTTMKYMFNGCTKLNSLDVAGWDTSKVTDMWGTFRGCAALPSLDLSGWDTSNVTYMVEMFQDCTALVSVDVSGWDTSNVTQTNYMFKNCAALTSLDASGWDTSKVTNMYSMFDGCKALRTIYASELWSTEGMSSAALGLESSSAKMFNNCYTLRGKISYSSSKVDGRYANYTTGYLTYKAAPAKAAARAMSIMSSGSEISGYSVSE